MKLYEVYLTEATNYNEMFNSVLSIAEYVSDIVPFYGSVKKNIEEEIDWAKKTLRKNDRIVWYLRVLKYYWLKKLNEIDFSDKLDENDKIFLKQKIEKEINKLTSKFNYVIQSLNITQNSNKVAIEHFLSLPVDKIQNYVWSDQTSDEILKTFEEYEEEWKEKSGEKAVEIQEGDQLIIPFENETKGWWLLNRGACESEGESMGHCGNVPSFSHGDRILSFRIKNENDEWTPVLTFILHEDGYLGEMKGRGNEKPAKRYHPYIVELLKNTKLIKGIKGGGYMPESNFNINDLEEKEREELTSINPELLPFVDMFRKFGEKSKLVIDKAIFIMDEYLDYVRYDKENNYFVIEIYEDAHDLVFYRGNSQAKHISEFIKTGELLEFYGVGDSDSEISDFLNYFEMYEKKKGYNTVHKIIKWLQDYDPDAEINNNNWIEYIIEENVTDITHPVTMAITDGMREAAESEMFETFRRQVIDYVPNEYNIGEMVFTGVLDNGESDIYQPIHYIFKIRDLVKLIYDEGGGEVEEIQGFDLENMFTEEINIDEPYMGWGSNDIDEETAIRYFYDHIEDYISS